MTDDMGADSISLEELKARAAALGIPIRDDQWQHIAPMLGRALAPLCAFDSDDLKRLEPSGTFRAATDHEDRR